jgi:MFS family permease
MLGVAIGWQVYDLTGSAFDLGLVGLAQFVPMVLLALVVGHVADRYDRRVVVRICQCVEAVTAAALSAATAAGWIDTGGIYAAAFLLGAARAFEMPSFQALLPSLVPAAIFTRSVAWASSATQSAVIVGPALGGALYLAGPAFIYAACGFLFLLASLLIGAIVIERRVPPREKLTLSSLLAGLVFIQERPILLGIISLDLFAVLLGGAVALLPIFARDILETGPIGLGLLRSAPAVGALAMAMFLTRRPVRRHAGMKMFGAVAAFGVATLVFALSTSLPLSLAALVALGAADMVSVVLRLSLVQIETPDAMRGRVNAINSLFIGTSNQLGEFESGVTAAWFGVVPAVLLGGLGTLLVALLWMRLFPTLRRLDALEPPAP